MTEKTSASNPQTISRNDLQIGRRLFHMSTGTIVSLFYYFTFEHVQLVQIIGFICCIIYLFEQIRTKYPEIASRFHFLTKFLLRTEEQLNESAAMPYAIGIFLTIITFPKSVAITAILILAFGDPLSAIVGISCGKRKISSNKSLEGSFAFFLVSLLVPMLLIAYQNDFQIPSNSFYNVLKASFAIGLFGALFELIPTRIDDNLVIPLFSAINTWIFFSLFNVPFL